ncbi:alpha/beta hydrolase [Streptococcus oralis]|nr:alpha/beta hydrolase [Streptococcus oralis]MCY7085384.1 alpha/beta hydrolase [Streptococcus oralis]
MVNDAVLTDGLGIGVGTGHHYSSAYQFYEDVLKKNNLNPEDVILTGHSLGGNVAQRVALKYNVPKTIVYNAAPLYVPAGAGLGNGLIGNPLVALATAQNIAKIESDKAQFTGSVTRITTEKDPLNNLMTA